MRRASALSLALLVLIGLLVVGLPIGVGTAVADTGSSGAEAGHAAASGETVEFGSASSFASVDGAAWRDGGTDAAQTDDSIVETAEYRLLPDQPDRVEVEIRYAMPDDVASLSFQFVGGSYDLVSTDGFTDAGNGQFEWDGESDVASVTIRHDVAESFRPEEADEQYVGGGEDWAIVARPQTSTGWEFYGSDPGVDYRLEIDGEGRAGQRLAYLGPHQTHQRSVGGETLTLVVPDAADLESSPDAILESMAHASDRLRVGHRSDEVVVIATPTDGHDWSPPGLSLTSDARVIDDAAVEDDLNVWVHEYVHTRQYRDHFDPNHEAIADDVRWIVEGSADYYAALTSLEQGYIDFAAFRDVLDRGTDENAVLAEPSTWADSEADYQKGALVAGALDRELRMASDGEHTLQAVIREWNRAETFTADDLEAAAAEYGDESVREFVQQYTTTEATPALWGRDAHRQYFETDVAQFDYSTVSEPKVSVSGPYRDVALSESLVTGEAVTSEVRVENVGDVAGGYQAVLSVGGERAATATGRLRPGESETVSLEHTLEQSGTYTLVVGDFSQRVVVREPAEPKVAEFSVASGQPVVGEDVPVTATVRNPTFRPAAGEIELRIDGEVVDAQSVQLGPNGTTTVELTAVFDSPGEHEVDVGGATLTVDAREGTPLDRLPGFGVAAALVAILAGALLAARRT